MISTYLAVVQLPYPLYTLIQGSVNSCSNSQRASNDSADADKEAREALGAGFSVDDFHRRDVLVAISKGVFCKRSI